VKWQHKWTIHANTVKRPGLRPKLKSLNSLRPKNLSSPSATKPKTAFLGL